MFGFLKKSLKGGGTPAPEPAAPANPAAPEAAPGTLVAPPTAPARPAPAAAPAAAAEPDKKRSWMDRLRAGLSRTRDQIGGGLSSLFSRRKIDEELLEELETTLLMADCGVEATGHLLKELRLRWKRDKLETADQLQGALAEGLLSILQPLEQPLEISGHKPAIMMM